MSRSEANFEPILCEVSWSLSQACDQKEVREKWIAVLRAFLVGLAAMISRAEHGETVAELPSPESRWGKDLWITCFVTLSSSRCLHYSSFAFARPPIAKREHCQRSIVPTQANLRGNS